MFFIDDKIDTGQLILQESTQISPIENAGSLHDKLMHLGSEIVLKTVKLIESGPIKSMPQTNPDDLKTAYKLNKDNCQINWNDSLQNIYNKIRGLSPYPGAWSLLINGDEQLNVKIYKCDKEIILTDNHIKNRWITS